MVGRARGPGRREVTGVAFCALLVEGSAASDPAVKCTCYASAAAASVAYIVAQAYVDRK